MPSATGFSVREYERQAKDASALARELRELARSIRSISAPLTSAYDLASSRHLEGIWISAAAHRSRQELASIRASCGSASEAAVLMAAALERAALGADADARSASRLARTLRDEEAAAKEAAAKEAAAKAEREAGDS